jgi:glycosyltransferase involved in cell wall biosynthesis
MPLHVSVVIPAYNAARFLPEAIESIRRQSRAVHQIIVVDDGSKDDTAQVVAGLGPDVTYVHQTNAGVSAARNRGIQEATGDIVAFLDADDRWLPGKVEKQLAVFERNPQTGLVGTDRSDVDANDQVLLDSLFRKQGLYDEFVELDGRPMADAFSRLILVNFLPTSSVMVSKRVLAAVGGFETTIRYGEDLELWARIAARYPLVCLPDVLVLYRLHDSNAIHQTERLLVDMVRVMQRIRSWGSQQMLDQGLNADRIVAQSQWELGYWYLNSGQFAKARGPFWAGFRESASARALIYALLSFLPPGIIRALRKTKQQIMG